ncbi:hypothetical protein [Amycolatopsis sp. WAC 01416]|nr:hypothetical protein [Amycolatopsis sp. WAC 01416]
MPEVKTVKNRMRIGVFGSTPELVAAGAKLVRDGNEFCVFTPNET